MRTRCYRSNETAIALLEFSALVPLALLLILLSASTYVSVTDKRSLHQIVDRQLVDSAMNPLTAEASALGVIEFSLVSSQILSRLDEIVTEVSSELALLAWESGGSESVYEIEAAASVLNINPASGAFEGFEGGAPVLFSRSGGSLGAPSTEQALIDEFIQLSQAQSATGESAAANPTALLGNSSSTKRFFPKTVALGLRVVLKKESGFHSFLQTLSAEQEYLIGSKVQILRGGIRLK